MDVRLTAEQRQLREAAAKLADDLGPGSVADLSDESRIARLEKAVDATGLADAALDGASGVEVAIVAEEFARGLVDVPFVGPVLADDLQTVGTTADVGTGKSHRGSHAEALAGVCRVTGELEKLADEDRDRLHALALIATTADIVGAARGTLHWPPSTPRCASSTARRSVRIRPSAHLLAESLALIEGSISVLRHAAWAVDELAPAEAIDAANVAKIYCARAARTVCETSIQVHGGIGNTWECLAHVYLRRA